MFTRNPSLHKIVLVCLPPLILTVVTFAVYWSTLGHDFLTGWDDPTYVTNNEVIRGFTWEHTKTVFTTFYVGNYAPVQMLSYMLDYSIWGMKAAGFLFSNILYHAASGVMLYLILTRLYGRRVWTFLATLLFLLHPVQVESVAWISQRKNVLAMLFFLASWYGYIIHREKRGSSKVAYFLSLMSFSLALLAKSTAVILPPVLLLCNVCFPERPQRKGFLTDVIPYAIIAGIVALLALKSQAPEFDGGRVHAYYGGSLLNTALTMLPVLARYLGMLFWPVNLSAWYDPLIRTGVDTTTALSGILILVLILVGIELWQRKRELFFWYALFFIGIIPVSQIVPLTTLMNDRYLYFPMLGAAPFICGLILPSVITIGLLQPGKQLAQTAILAAATLMCGVGTVSRSAIWKDSVTLWTDTVAKAPNVHLVHHGLGCALLQAGRLDEAVSELTTALKINGNNVETYNQLGIAYGKRGEFDRAITLFETALKLDPSSEPARKNLALARYGKEKFRSR